MEKNQADIDISFCLPIYNVSPWLKKCIDSILAVEGIKFEIICVDDMSTDDSYAVLLDIAKGHDNIIVKRNDVNRGVSYSRNVALREAKGRYIWFVDSDDMIVPGYARLFVHSADEEYADAVLGDYISIEENDNRIRKEVNNKYLVIRNSYDDEHFSRLLPSKNSHNSMRTVWGGIFRHTFLKEHNIRFCEKIYFCEDIVFYYPFEVYFERVIKYPSPVYCYRKRQGSASRQFNDERQKKNFLGSRAMYYLYLDYLNNGVYNTIESRRGADIVSLCMKIHHIKQNTLQWLATVRDKEYVKEQLSQLKQEGIYPYKFRKEAIIDQKNMKGLLMFLLPLEPFFWLLNLLYKFKKQSQ